MIVVPYHTIPVAQSEAHKQTRKKRVNRISTPKAMNSVHSSIVAAYYEHHKGGAMVYCGTKFVLAVEFDGPCGNRGFVGEMAFVDLNPACQAVVQQRGGNPKDLGAAFLGGETIEFIECNNEDDFKELLKDYK